MEGLSGPVAALAAALRDRYELLGILGQGGFSTVYKARQLATEQPVALKLLRMQEGGTAAANERRLARFQRETKLCAQMHHPNIVRLIDSGSAEGVGVYTVFEFVPGKNLGQVLAEEGRLEPSEARHLMAQVLDALACAHAQGVVHRDIKPANLMVVPTGARRNVLVLDFGIGSFAEERQREAQPRLTLTSESIGTPAYAAPEQLLGEPPTPRSDLYTWGLVFLECLTGRRIMEGATVAELMYRQLSPEPVPLPAMLVGHPLGRLLQRVTVKSPALREVTAQELLLELEACDLSGLRYQEGVVQPPLELTTPEHGWVPEVGVRSGPEAPGGARGARWVEGERRQLTALCCKLNVLGLGPGGGDIEELDQQLGMLLEACTRIVQRFGGQPAGALGDEVLFYFGYPVAREDDARRAARAALMLAAEVRARGMALMAERKARVEVRLGLHTGLVVAHDPATHGLGSTPRLAARLCALAQPGSILVSADTWRLLRRRFALEEAGLRQTDGAPYPVEAYLLREGAPSAGPWTVPLTSREQELASLLEEWRRTRGGLGRTVVLSGEPGIGKSRLASEVGARLRAQGVTWLECHCMPEGMNTPLFAITRMLERLLDPACELGPEGKVERLEPLLSRLGFDLAQALPLLSALLSLPLPERWQPLDISAQKHREMTREVILALLFGLAEQAPLALLVEDVQWADPSTLELLGQLVEDVQSARLYALFCARPEFQPAWPASAVQFIHLGRLERPEVERLAARIAGGRELPAEVLEQVVGRTDGVPLFIEELLQAMLEAGVLEARGERYELTRALSGVSIPGTLRDLLTARLDRLGRAKETAQVASALGREFSLELLQAASVVEAAAVQEDLDRLMAAELLYRKRRPKGATYLFKHALVRDAAYESMLKRSRQQVHARVARAIEEHFPELARERPELVAQHCAAAGQEPQAIRYAQQAALVALQRSANAEALAHARQALEWLHSLQEPRERAELELALNGIITPALMATRGYGDPELERMNSRSLEIMDSLGESPQIFPTLWALCLYHHMCSHRARAREFAERMLALAERGGQASADSGQTTAALTALSLCLWMEGRFPEARARLEHALALYDTQRHRGLAYAYGLDPKAWAHMILGIVLWFLGHPDQAQLQVELSLAWTRELKQQNGIGLALVIMTMLHHLTREPEAVMLAADEAIEVSERYGLPFNRNYASLIRSWASLDVDGASRILDTHQRVGQVAAMPYYRSILAEVEAAHGRVDVALAHLDGCLRFAEEHGDRYYVAELLRLQGVFLLRREPTAGEAAEHCFRQALSVSRSQGARLAELRATVDLCRLLRAQGRASEARALLAGLLGGFTESVSALREARALLEELGG